MAESQVTIDYYWKLSAVPEAEVLSQEFQGLVTQLQEKAKSHGPLCLARTDVGTSFQTLDINQNGRWAIGGDAMGAVFDNTEQALSIFAEMHEMTYNPQTAPAVLQQAIQAARELLQGTR